MSAQNRERKLVAADPMKKPHVILVLYYTRGVYPLRDTIATHLYCWGRYSRYRVIYVNVAFGLPWRRLRRMRIAGIVFHTIFLAMRWSPALFLRRAAECEPLAALDVPKLALPQDEFIHTDMLAEFLAGQRITHLYTCAEERDWRAIYGRHVDFARVQARTVLTGYVDDATRARVDRMKRPPRVVDVGYRAWKAAYWLGGHGQHKVRVAEAVDAAACGRGLAVDSSLRDEDALLGDDWFRFLLGCRATVGVEGGASLLDRDGSLRETVESYVKAHPAAGFEEVRDACFPGRDGELGLVCISPRHIEACLTRTCQILVEGRYSGILQPWVHYIPVSKDYSDVGRALDALADPALVARMVDAAYDDVVASGKWTYRAFVRETEADIFDRAALPRMDLRSWLYYAYFRLRDWGCWRYIQLECALHGKKDRSPLLRGLYRLGRRFAPAW